MEVKCCTKTTMQVLYELWATPQLGYKVSTRVVLTSCVY